MEQDLCIIMLTAGIVSLLFKMFKQPVVLGYIVAGFLASPNMPYMPSVTDLEGIHLWSDIGVIYMKMPMSFFIGFFFLLVRHSAIEYLSAIASFVSS